VAPSFLSGTTSRLLLVRREGLDWSKDTTASATAVLDNYGKHVGELDHLIQPVALRVQVICNFNAPIFADVTADHQESDPRGTGGPNLHSAPQLQPAP